jgi:hypothetical protein
MKCEWCNEEILPGERAPNRCSHYHFPCLFRAVSGSVGHQNKRCSCFGGNEDDPPGITKRQAAEAALARYKELNHP